MMRLLRLLLVLGIVATIGLGWHGWAIYQAYMRPDPNPRPERTEAYKAAKQVSVTPLRDGMYMLQGDGGNITASIGPDGILIVDSDGDWMAPKIRAALRELDPGPVKYVINTHSHGDHRGGNGFFRSEGAEIIAHRETHENMKHDNYSPAVPEDMPTLLIDGEHRMRFNGQQIRLWHPPYAHTNGDLMVHFEAADVIATGDVFTHLNLPFLSNDSGATLDAMLAAQRQLHDLAGEQTIIVPGHGPLADRDDLARTTDVMQSARDRMALGERLGLNKRLILLVHPFAAVPDDWTTQPSYAKEIARRYYDSLR